MRVGIATALLAFFPAFLPRAARADGAFPDSLGIILPSGNPNQIAVATNFGLILTEDSGQTWQWVCEVDALRSANFYQVGPPPLNRFFAVSRTGVVFSDDAACTWQGAAGQISGAYAQDVFPDPSNPQHVLATGLPRSDAGHGPAAVFESNDGGLTFEKVFQVGPADGILGVEVAASDPNVIYVPWYSTPGVHPKLARTHDGGLTWETIDLEPSVGSAYVRIVAVDRANPQRIYLRIEGSLSEALAISDDGGTAISKPLEVDGLLGGFAILPSGTIVVGGLHTSGGTTMGIAFRSTDGGRTFEPWPATPRIRALAQRDGMLYIAADDARDGFALAVSADEGTTFVPVMKYSDVSTMASCVETVCGPNCSYQAALGIWPSSVCGSYGVGGTGGRKEEIDQPQGCHCALVAGTPGPGALGAFACALLLIVRRRPRSSASASPRRIRSPFARGDAFATDRCATMCRRCQRSTPTRSAMSCQRNQSSA
jgi:photosystem II stability/assembly factor-like uncharacterized protein